MSRAEELADKYKIMDIRGLLESFDEEKDILEEMIDTFLMIFDEKISSLKTSVNENDLKGVGFLAHNIKGAVSNFSADPIVSLLKKMEIEANAEKTNEIGSDFEQVELYIGQLKEILILLKDELNT